MKPIDLPADARAVDDGAASDAPDLLTPLLTDRVRHPDEHREPRSTLAVVVGELLGLVDGGETALVIYPGQAGTAALRARTTLDLQGPQIGASVVLMFEAGDATRPIVMGVIRGRAGWPLADKPAEVQVNADGNRMMVTARDELVLRCGEASITLTKTGKVLIEGSYLLSRSTGVNRIKGGSVQLN